MRIDSIELDGFGPFGHAFIDLSSAHLASVVGGNGNGKSKAFVEAPIFALTGAKTRGSLDQWVMSEPEQREECSVSVVFSPDSEQRYKVTRTRSIRGRGKSTAELVREVDGQWVADTTGADEVTARVKTLIGADEDLLLVTSIIAQDEAKAFLSKTPAERLEVLGKILSLDKKYGPYEAHWKEQAGEAKLALAKAREDVERYTAECETLAEREELSAVERNSRETAQARLVKLEREHASIREAAEQAKAAVPDVDEVEKRLRELEDRKHGLTDRQTALRQERSTLQARIADKDELLAKQATRPDIILELASLEEAEKSDAAIREKRASLDARLQAAEQTAAATVAQGKAKATEEESLHKRVTDVVSRIDAIVGAEAPLCDRCGQPIADAALEQTLAQLTAERDTAQEKAAAAKGEVEELIGLLAQQKADADTIREAISALPPYAFDQARYSQLKRLRDELDEIPAKLSTIAAAEERVLALNKEYKAVSDELADDAIWDGIDEGRAVLAGAEEKRQAWEAAALGVGEAERHVFAAREAVTEAEKALAAHEEAIKMLLPSREKLETAKAAETEQAAALEDAEYLKKAFGKNGIPLMIVGNVVADLEREVNELTGLYDGGMHVTFETTKETKAGDTRDSLEIIVDRNGYPSRAYSGFSGGEKYRIASCVRLGLALLMARRAGARISTLILDEPEGLDESGQAHLVKILEHLSDRFERILLISHHDFLKDALPSHITVSRGDDDMSRVEVES